MLDRLRFQEIEKAIFKVRESGTYGNRSNSQSKNEWSGQKRI